MEPPLGLRRRLAAFTLVEILVSMAVLLLLLVLVTQLINGASRAIGFSGKHLDSDSEARLLFNRMAVDIAHAVKRPDVDYSSFKQPAGTLDSQYASAPVPVNLQAGNDTMAFYSETDGYFSGTQPQPAQKAPVPLVAYMVDNDPFTATPALRRMSKGLGWDPDAGGAWANVVYLPLTFSQVWGNLFATGANADPDYKTVGSQVVRFEYTYLLKSTTALAQTVSEGATAVAPLFITPYDTKLTPTAHTSINGFTDVAAIVAAIAVIDSTSRALVTSYTKLTSKTLFPDAKDCSSDSTYHGDIAAAWNAEVNSAAFPTDAGIPRAAASEVRIYERYFYLDGLK